MRKVGGGLAIILNAGGRGEEENKERNPCGLENAAQKDLNIALWKKHIFILKSLDAAKNTMLGLEFVAGIFNRTDKGMEYDPLFPAS